MGKTESALLLVVTLALAAGCADSGTPYESGGGPSATPPAAGNGATGYAPGTQVTLKGTGPRPLYSDLDVGSRPVGKVRPGVRMTVIGCAPNDGLWCQVQADPGPGQGPDQGAAPRGWVQAKDLRAQ